MHTSLILPMRTLSLLAALTVAGHFLSAGETVIPVNSQSLQSWTVLGETISVGPAGQSIVLPADTQVLRAFSGRGIAVSLTTKPHFGAIPDECPVLEIGSSALVFLRTDQTATLALVNGEAEPVIWSVPVELDGGGNALAAMEITLAVVHDAVTVSLDGNRRTFPIQNQAIGSAEVILSTGKNTAWAFDQLSVTVSTPDAVAIASSSPSSGSAGDTVGVVSGSVDSSGHSLLDSTGGVADALPKEVEAKAEVVVVGRGALEVFTPPSVRHGRSELVRTLAFEAGKN